MSILNNLTGKTTQTIDTEQTLSLTFDPNDETAYTRLLSETYTHGVSFTSENRYFPTSDSSHVQNVIIKDGSTTVFEWGNNSESTDYTELNCAISDTDLRTEKVILTGKINKYAFPNIEYTYSVLRDVTQAEVDEGKTYKAPHMTEVCTVATQYSKPQDLSYNEEHIVSKIVSEKTQYGSYIVHESGVWVYTADYRSPDSVWDSFDIITEEGTKKSINIKVDLSNPVSMGTVFIIDPETSTKIKGESRKLIQGHQTLSTEVKNYNAQNIKTEWPPTNPHMKRINNIKLDERHSKDFIVTVRYQFKDLENKDIHEEDIDFKIKLNNTTNQPYVDELKIFLES